MNAWPIVSWPLTLHPWEKLVFALKSKLSSFGTDLIEPENQITHYLSYVMPNTTSTNPRLLCLRFNSRSSLFIEASKLYTQNKP